MHERGYNRAGGHLRSDFLDVAGRELSFFEHRSGGHVNITATLEPGGSIGKLTAIAAEHDRIGRRQRIHDADQIRRTERGQEKTCELATHVERALELADVILVPEHQEQTHVVFRGFQRGVLPRSDRQRFVVIRRWRAVDFDQLERLDRLLDPVFLNLEVVFRQIGDRLAALVEHRRIDTNELGASSEDRRLLLVDLARRLLRGSLAGDNGTSQNREERCMASHRSDRSHTRRTPEQKGDRR